MTKKNLLGAAIVLSLGLTGTAHAFSVNTGYGTGTIDNVGGFDWAPGSALGVDSLPLPTYPATKAFTVYSQAHLAAYLKDTSGTISDANLNTNYEITYVAGFGEIGTALGIPGLIQTGIFSFDPTNSVNFFKVFYDNTPATFANALEGTGYDDGKLVLAGVIVNDDGGSNVTNGNFTVNFLTPTGNLDQNGVNNWAGFTSYAGDGSNKAVIDLTAQNQQYNFFNGLDISGLTTLTILSSNATTPFSLTDPAKKVAGITSNPALINGDPSCSGAVGGAPCNFLFQNDGAQKLKTVPEPGTLTLLGMGLLGAGLSRRRKNA